MAGYRGDLRHPGGGQRPVHSGRVRGRFLITDYLGVWFHDKVLPGLLTGIPYILIGGGGLYLNWRAGRKNLRDQTKELQRNLDEQTEALRRHVDERTGKKDVN